MATSDIPRELKYLWDRYPQYDFIARLKVVPTDEYQKWKDDIKKDLQKIYDRWIEIMEERKTIDDTNMHIAWFLVDLDWVLHPDKLDELS